MNDNIKSLLRYLKNYKTNLIIVFCSLCIVAIAVLGFGMIFRHLVAFNLKHLSSNRSHLT